MKTKKRIFLLAFSTLFFANVHTVNAQVTIGGETEPVKGTTLDLSPAGGYRGGLKLPNIELTSLTEIPTGIKGFTDASTVAKSELVGTVVYNTDNTLGAGVYIWDGSKWQAMLSSGTSSLLNNIYPIGSIYMSIDSTDPTDIFGGTWEPWGEGRVPVGVGGVAPFNGIADEVGGSYWSGLRAAIGPKAANPSTWAAQITGTVGVRYTHSITTSISSSSESVANAHSIPVYTTSGATPSNVQPFVLCYMWKRTS